MNKLNNKILLAVFGVAFLIIMFLLALNGRYYVFDDIYLDKWTGMFHYVDNSLE